MLIWHRTIVVAAGEEPVQTPIASSIRERATIRGKARSPAYANSPRPPDPNSHFRQGVPSRKFSHPARTGQSPRGSLLVRREMGGCFSAAKLIKQLRPHNSLSPNSSKRIAITT